jgi:hypothetical protein
VTDFYMNQFDAGDGRDYDDIARRQGARWKSVGIFTL